MYTKGDLKTHRPCEPDYDNCTLDFADGHHCGTMTDSRTEGYDDVPHGTVFLPHSCDEWVIGGPEQIRTLIEDLQAALK